MIYVCIPSHNEAPTVGLLLWKIRQVFTEFPREYQLVVADDGSTDATADVLGPYARVLPLTVIRHERQLGYGRTIEELLRLAVDRTDRPRRDCAILMHADFAHGPHYLPDLVRRIESGADLVVAQASLSGEPSRGRRMVRRFAPMLLRGRVRVPGVSDLVSGFAAFRLSTLRSAFRDGTLPILSTDGWAANAELIGRTARYARRIETVAVVERHDLRPRASRVQPWETARRLWHEAGRLHLPAAPPPAPAGRNRADAEAEAGATT
jgi:glycosyltransferase involved in cell wall biosynthesis